jgi:hypothetical protein
MESASEPSIRASGFGVLAFAALVGAILLGAMFAGDASDVGGILPIGGAAVIALAASLLCVALARIPTPRVGRSGALVVGAAVALTIWIGATMWWSIAGDRSWEAFNKAVAYCAFLGLGVMLAAVGRRFAARLPASMLSVVIGATVVWALIAKAVPALDPEGDRVARLREPVGYWNALALLADIAIVLGLWLGTTREHRRVIRVGGALLVYAATLALASSQGPSWSSSGSSSGTSAWGAGSCSWPRPGPRSWSAPGRSRGPRSPRTWRRARIASATVRHSEHSPLPARSSSRGSSSSAFGDLSMRRRVGASDEV